MRRIDSGPVRVLVVEDDQELWPVVRRALRSLDPEIEVEFAADFRAARRSLCGRERYALVLADFLLADSETGWELRSLCESEQPGAAFAMTSSMPIRLPELRSTSFLPKPYTLEQCRCFVSRMIATERMSAGGPDAAVSAPSAATLGTAC